MDTGLQGCRLFHGADDHGAGEGTSEGMRELIERTSSARVLAPRDREAANYGLRFGALSGRSARPSHSFKAFGRTLGKRSIAI